MSHNNTKKIKSIIYTKDFLSNTLDHNFSDSYISSYSNVDLRFDFIMEQIFTNDIKANEIGLVTIDEECSKWLNENGLENSKENHLLYASQVTEDKMRELWIKHSFNIHYDLQYIPVISHKKENDFCSGNIKLSQESINTLKDDVANHLKCDTKDIIILPHAYRLDYIMKNNHKLYNYAINEFENDQPEILPPGLYKQQNNVEVIERFVAVLIRSDIDCMRNIHTFYNELDKSHSEYVYSASTTKELCMDFGNNEVTLLPSLVSTENIEDYSEQFYDSFITKSLECV